MTHNQTVKELDKCRRESNQTVKELDKCRREFYKVKTENQHDFG